MRSIPLLLLILIGVGCSSTTKRTYEIAIRNESDRPVTLWLTKDGPPDELGWISPERYAIAGVKEDVEDLPIQTLPPGQVARVGPVTGEFEGDARGVVRIYDGDLDFNQILSVSEEGPLRVDLTLRDGANLFVVRRAGALSVDRVKDTPASR